jgi:hypothetical protein
VRTSTSREGFAPHNGMRGIISRQARIVRDQRRLKALAAIRYIL